MIPNIVFFRGMFTVALLFLDRVQRFARRPPDLRPRPPDGDRRPGFRQVVRPLPAAGVEFYIFAMADRR
jgi:hypothetical protein